jgi:hypothetical protein
MITYRCPNPAVKLAEPNYVRSPNSDSTVTEVLRSVTFLEQADSYEEVVVAMRKPRFHRLNMGVAP